MRMTAMNIETHHADSPAATAINAENLASPKPILPRVRSLMSQNAPNPTKKSTVRTPTSASTSSWKRKMRASIRMISMR
jgi:hypothetical protein